jgi:ssDNA-binding Zn-finger/Zn-ribbon topoisomerase 1
MLPGMIEDIGFEDVGPRFPGERDDLTCGECGMSKMRLIALPTGHFYGCARYPTCRGTHGAHPDGSPMGTPGDTLTREARMRAHEIFDQLWKTGKMSRDDAYKWLAQKLGMTKETAHIGRFDVKTCERVIKHAKARLKEGIILTAWRRLMGDDEY